MASMAVVGSIAGKRMASRMDVRSINRLYALTLIVVMALCVRNFIALG